MIPFLYKLGAGLAVALALLWYVTDLRHDRDKARQERAQAVAEAKAAHAQADLNNTASQAVEAAQSRALTITVKAQESAHAVAIAPGGDQLVSDSVLELWRSGVVQLRDEAAASRGPASSSPGEPAGAVSTPADPG